ncbi:uncharacterized protein CANTADRAFT_55610 [Suhomyces tanzawaensis NRRL Y-17324]|uniref:Cwf19-like C-terminal domain-containing protein n=1 Tax=Suhomyces tanzawaensis NRRL Y-17324 TaxID=984487 RepID=A0A1E4SCZ6_9ASCO|nr:uncharacterized protein CANTADRAFT_55610 [Suhomyces tanzawaensis NRRL Y-17324]ODV77389.1 hypothetical protein CANTADRAFT_55610 [Suhomyces tanzawaensis NRRL Y-17324]
MSTKSKFLVLNPSPSNLESVLGKANLQNEKNGPFEAVFLLGDVITKGKALPNTEIKQPTYFTQGAEEFAVEVTNGISSSTGDSDLIDILPNLTVLKSLVNVLKVKSGTKIMIVSGASEIEENQREALRLANISQVDILITYNWPQALAKQEQLSLVGNNFIDELVKQVKPKYHFCVGHEYGKFFENQAFKWESGEVTRFISLGQEGSGEKWFYGFNSGGDPDETKLGENPFTRVSVKPKRNIDEVNENLESVSKRPKVTPESCFFCLSNPKAETHMIVSIGNNVYLTIAKGPLTRSNGDLSFSGHAIIIPIEHIPTLRSNSTNVISSPVFQEVLQYQKSLVKAFHTKAPNYRLVFYEVCRGTNVHQNTQVVPIPEHLVGKLKEDIVDRAIINNEKFQRNHPLEFKVYNEDDPEYIRIINTADYISLVIYESSDSKVIYLSELTDELRPVDFQFPRRALASALNTPKRIYWEKCQQSRTRETRECDEFKAFLDGAI